MVDEERQSDSIPDRIRELGVRWREGRSVSVAALYLPEATAWLANQPRVSLVTAASSIGRSAGAVRRALGDFFPADMLESKRHRQGFLAGAIWVLIEVSDSWIEASERERTASSNLTGSTRAQQVLTAVTERLRSGMPLGAKEVLSDASLQSLELRADEVSRAFGTLLGQRRVRVVSGKDRRRRLFQYISDPAAQTHTVTRTILDHWQVRLAQCKMDINAAIEMDRELVVSGRGPDAVGPSLALSDEAFRALVGRDRSDKEAPPTLCFAKDSVERSMEVSLYVDDSIKSIDMVVATLQTSTGDVKAALFRDSGAGEPTRRFHGHVIVGDVWPTVTSVRMNILSDVTV